ncbi:uncharacterized protein V6R79_016011 [Siganus canaliculatus]
MGTKRPSCTLFDPSSNINTSDRKLQPGGKISRDPSPRPAMTAQSGRERDTVREEDWRREREMEKMRDKARYKDMDPRDKYYDRDRGPASRTREGERQWRDREKELDFDRNKNGRPLSSVEREAEREGERGKKKGDTFPRLRKRSADRGERRHRDRPRGGELDDWERERERTWHRERERDDLRGRGREEGPSTGRRHVEDERPRQRDRYQEFDAGVQDRRRDASDTWDRREREKLRPDVGRRGTRTPSPYDRDRRVDSGRREQEKTQKREGRRDTRSDGDSDERELRREKVRDGEREEIHFRHCRSEGDNMETMEKRRDRDKHGYREEERQRHRDRNREREVDRSRRREVEKERYREHDRGTAREATRGEERWRESERDVRDDRRQDDRYREHKPRKNRDARGRDADPRWDESAGRGGRSGSETAPRVTPRAQSSGEWSTTESDRDVDEQRNPERTAERSQREQKRSERPERERGEMTGGAPEQRRMWLEPQRGTNSREGYVDRERQTREKESRVESQAEWGRAQEEAYERYLDQSSHRDRRGGINELREREAEGVSVDGEDVGEAWRDMNKARKGRPSDSDGRTEGSWLRSTGGDNVTDNTEESDREEQGGSDCWEGGSETCFTQDRHRMPSGEDGFVTVSSGGDEEDDREEEDEEDQFEDCQEFLESGVPSHGSSVAAFKGPDGDEEREEETDEKQPKYVFCVIGQTLPRSKARDKSPSQGDQLKEVEKNSSVLKGHHQDADDAIQHFLPEHYPTLSGDEHTINNSQPREERASSEGAAEVDIRYKVSPQGQNTDAGEKMRPKKEHPYAEIGPAKRDSQTERLLVEWREKNKEGVEKVWEAGRTPSDVDYPQVNIDQIQPFLDGINTGAMSPEEVEAIRIRLSGAWSISEEPKRHSQAPHLKWAKSVVREILGHSEENTFDEPSADIQGEPGVGQSEIAVRNDKQLEEVAQETGHMPELNLRADEVNSEPELEEEEPLEVEGLRGMGPNQADMHADQFSAMHGDTPTYTHADTLLGSKRKEDPRMDGETEPSGRLQSDKEDLVLKTSEEADNELKLNERETDQGRESEVDMYLSVSNTLYKPSSCPILSYETEFDLHVPSREGEDPEVDDRMGESDEDGQEEGDATEEAGKMREGEETEVDRGEVVEGKKKGGAVASSCSFRDLGPEARFRRRGIRKTTERRNGEHVEEEEGVARDRRTRIFSTTDDEDDRSKSWGEVELGNVLEAVNRRKRNSKFFNAAQLYQQYSEAAQNFEILRQARSDVLSVSEETTSSPAPSPPPARRPLPPLPPVRHPHSLSHTPSITSAQSLPLPEPPKTEGRPSSPRLSISLTQSSTLWRELPAVRNSTELEELTEDQRRLQEVRFEVVTSEASYCRSLDIVVDHFVKSKQLGALLTTQDKNWLFSRLADVRAISHSFLAKLEERVETDVISFTVCDIIARHCQRFKMVYVPYLANQSYQDATYQRLMNENPQFRRIVEKLERSPVCQRLPLRSFLVLPFQRITRIKLLVQNIVKRTTPGTPEATQAIKSLKLLEKLIQESNDSITQMKSIESLVSLSARVDFECRTLPLISQSRRLVREGPITELMDFSLKDREKNIYLHLFNDYLLISLQKEGGRFSVVDHSPVSELRAENCRVKLHSLQKNLFRLHMSHKSLLLRTDTLSDKLRWISALSRPHPDVDFSAAQDFLQMQCIRAVVGQQPDELSLEKADIILVHQQSSDHWVEGTRLSDRHRGWIPESHLETISNARVRQRNLSDALKLTTATAAV